MQKRNERLRKSLRIHCPNGDLECAISFVIARTKKRRPSMDREAQAMECELLLTILGFEGHAPVEWGSLLPE